VSCCSELEALIEQSGLSHVLRVTNLIRKAHRVLHPMLLFPTSLLATACFLASCCSELEALIEQSGLSHVLRVTNLIRKAHCVLAKPRWDNGRAVNLQQHRAAADKARVPFLTVQRLDVLLLLEAVRPLLLRKRVVVEPRQKQQQQRQQQETRQGQQQEDQAEQQQQQEPEQ
jgi:hypothetical protein